MKKLLQTITKRYNKDQTRLMDILIDTQAELGYISEDAVVEIARQLNISKVDVEQTATFYHFFSQTPRGKYNIYLNDSAVACMMGRDEIKKAFEQEAECKFGELSSDGNIGLFNTACIGMNDQEPAAIINGEVFTKLTPSRAKEIIKGLKAGKNVKDLFYQDLGDGNNSSEEIKSMVKNNIKREGAVIFENFTPGKTLKEKLAVMTPEQVIAEIKKSKIRGRGGAGFPTGFKWDICRKSGGRKRYVMCNADEGEPGTFKDRVILTERPEMLFEGMAVAGYAIGADEGILYLRFEYKYLEKFLEKVLQKARDNSCLGKNIAGIKGFDFDIRIQFGAGAYVCGEESALIESSEGKRGEPRDRPPFPVVKGYMNEPTVINNVETLCSVVRILEKGAEWYSNMGTNDSTGTKLLSISGDCGQPGVYEIEWGKTIREMLEMVEASDVRAVQVGGPSGTLIGTEEFDNKICYNHLSTGGSMIVIGNHRNLLKDVVLNFMEFFIEESCGSCTTCRILPVIMRDKLKKIISGRGVKQDIDDLGEWGKVLKASRCGLGQSAGNPILTSIKNFGEVYEKMIQEDVVFDTGFDLSSAVKESCEAVDRVPNIH
jgi:[NiFe] hydrogenase diaphorase moiety large subunit